MASVVEQRPNANLLHPAGFDLSVLVFDLKTESEWGEPGPPTSVPDLPDQLGPCMCAPRRHRYKFFRADPILRTSDTGLSVTEFPPVPWPDPQDFRFKLKLKLKTGGKIRPRGRTM